MLSLLIPIINRADTSNLDAGFVHDYVVSSEAQTEEGIILEGSMTDTVRNETFCCGDYCRVLPGHQHGPYRADSAEGALCFVVTRKTKI